MSETLPDAALDRLFRSARSRNGWSDRRVDAATIRAIYDLAKLGPTSMNTSPARFVWVTAPEAKERLAACASGANGPKIVAAPATVIVARDPAFFERMDYLFAPKPEMQAMMRNVPPMAEATGVRNTTLQGAYLMIAARALGLDCGPMSGFDAGKVEAEFLADRGWKPDFLCSIGYGTDEGLFPRLPRLDFDEANVLL